VIIDRYYCDILATLEPVELKFGSMLYRNEILTRSVMLKKALPNRFLKGQRFSEDYRLWLGMLADNKRAVLLNIELASSYRPEYSSGGQSANLWKMQRSELEIYRDLYCNKHITLPWLISCALFSTAKFFIRCLKSYMLALNIRFTYKL